MLGKERLQNEVPPQINGMDEDNDATIAMMLRPYVKPDLSDLSLRVENMLEDPDRADRLRFMADVATTHL
jgi:hypothetical protein